MSRILLVKRRLTEKTCHDKISKRKKQDVTYYEKTCEHTWGNRRAISYFSTKITRSSHPPRVRFHLGPK